ncbi:MAG: hypothetical protein ACRELY_24580 [Polyangiaceae bacterium]
MSTEPTEKLRRFRSALALGTRLAGAGLLQKISLGICIVTVFGAIAVAVSLTHDAHPPLTAVPGLTAAVLAWGGGFTFAVAAAAHAFDRDLESGVRDLARTRGVSGRAYVLGRVLGLALSLFVIVGLGAIVTGAACAILGPTMRLAIMESTAATIPYAAAYALVVAPLCAATMGARARPRGYMFLLAILIVPELAQDSLEGIPEHWRSLVGIPSAMGTLRDSLTPAHFDVTLAGAAAAVIALLAILCIALSLDAAWRASRAENSA